MCRLKICCVAFALLNGLALAADDFTSSPSITAKLLKSEPTNKNQAFLATVDLKLSNSHDFPVWYLISAGNRHFRNDGNFSCRCEHWPDPFSGKSVYTQQAKFVFEATKYDEGHGAAILLGYGADDGFRAILLPPKARFHLACLQFETRDLLKFADVWEAKSIAVNGQTPLEQFLPYAVASSKGVEVVRDPKALRLARQRAGDDPFSDMTVTALNWAQGDPLPTKKAPKLEQDRKSLALPNRRNPLLSTKKRLRAASRM